MKLAEAYGWHGSRVTDPAEIDDALKRRSTTTGRRSSTAASRPRRTSTRWSPPGGSIDEMLGGIPGGPVSEMLDDELLEEVWE